MTLPLTPQRIAATYECLRSFPPFCRWKLPPADQVSFAVLQTTHLAADYQPDVVDRIRISAGRNGLFNTLASSVAHEMIHQRLKHRGLKNWHAHGAEFQRIAKAVCARFGWDPKIF